ncbi:NAD(P)H-binding protein, partial [Micrococcus sp. SIMBA_144]
MNITVFGANGQIGQKFLKEALDNNDKVKAVVRREGALEMTHPNLEIIVLNYKDKQQMMDAVAGQDAVVSTLGPSLNGGRKIKNLPIRDAHEMILKVMEEAEVKRFITLGTPAVKSGHDKKQMAII